MRWTTNVGSLYGNDSQPNQTTPPRKSNFLLLSKINF
jgi:hypothetical protein